MTTLSIGDWFLDPPEHLAAEQVSIPLILALSVALVAVPVGIAWTRHFRSPLFAMSALSGAVLYPFLVEPFGDWFVAVWYPTNHPIAATVFDRPMPWFVVLFYAGGIPLAVVAAYEIARRGLPARWLLAFTAVVVILEVPAEILGGHLGWMTYYGNHAVVAGVPVYCFVQNGGFLVVIAWVLAKALPQVHGWRWALVPLLVAAVLPVYALIATWPAYLAIHLEAGPEVGWAAGLLATAMNAAVVVACAYSPTMSRLRTERGVADVPVPTLAGREGSRG